MATAELTDRTGWPIYRNAYVKVILPRRPADWAWVITVDPGAGCILVRNKRGHLRTVRAETVEVKRPSKAAKDRKLEFELRSHQATEVLNRRRRLCRD